METLLRSPTTVLRIGVLYRPPPSTQNGLTVSLFFDEFPALLERLAVASGKLLLLGDFNFHIDDTTNRQASNFLELLNNHNLVQHIIGPTHKDSHTLYLVITRASEDTILRWSIMDTHLSDHKIIHAKLSLVRPRPQRIEKQYRKLRSVNSAAFRNDVMTSALFTSPARNVEDLCSQYDHELLKIVDSHAPLRTRMVTSRLSAPWYTEEIAIEKCKRRQLERRWRKSGLEADKQQFADQCKQVRELIKSTKVNHYSSLIMENKSDHKVLFHSINCLLHRIPEKHYPICGSTNELCNKFADFFSEKILKIRNQLDALQTDASSNFQHFDNVNMDCGLTEFPPTSIEELSRLVKKISTKSCSLDPVPATLLSYCIDDLLPIIQTVVNSSFESAVVPTSLKKAVLSPLLKKQDLDFETFSNFRPISNLKFLSKVIEKVAAERLWEYVRVNGLDETLQSAYKKQQGLRNGTPTCAK